MHIVASVAMSVDGYIDDSSGERLILSNPEDLAAVRELRASCDAILVGAETVRRDNPSLLIDDPRARDRRRVQGLQPDVVKITLTHSGELPRESHFFQAGEGQKLVYCAAPAAEALREKLGAVAEVVIVEPGTAAPVFVAQDLARRGIKKLLVEGGGRTHAAFLNANLVDNLRLAIAPFFIADARAPRFVNEAVPNFRSDRMELERVEQIGDMAVLHYALRREMTAEY